MYIIGQICRLETVSGQHPGPELGFIRTQNCVSALSDKLEEKYPSLSSNVSKLSISELLLDRTVHQPFVFLCLYFYYLISDSSTTGIIRISWKLRLLDIVVRMKFLNY